MTPVNRFSSIPGEREIECRPSGLEPWRDVLMCPAWSQLSLCPSHRCIPPLVSILSQDALPPGHLRWSGNILKSQTALFDTHNKTTYTWSVRQVELKISDIEWFYNALHIPRCAVLCAHCQHQRNWPHHHPCPNPSPNVCKVSAY